MSDEQLTKDGLLFFNTPDENKRKPNVIYYNALADSTGIEYVKLLDKKDATPQKAWFKAVMAVVGTLTLFSLISVIYLFVVKLRKKKVQEKVQEKFEIEEVRNPYEDDSVITSYPIVQEVIELDDSGVTKKDNYLTMLLPSFFIKDDYTIPSKNGKQV